MSVTTTFTWDGLNATAIASRFGLSNVWTYADVESTQDIAHGLASQGVPAGALVVADAQHAGRGRQGRAWSSPPGRGVWCTIIERPTDARALEVLSIRIGIRLAAALDEFADERVAVKWPNDLVLVIPSAAKDLQLAKLGGILCEARWTGSALAWVAVGVGINVIQPDVAGAAGLRSGTPRVEVLRAVVDSVRSAARAEGPLAPGEIAQFSKRDALAGCRILSPAPGVVAGIDESGALLVLGAAGIERHRSGMVEMEKPAR